jgi:hypothetical protein
MLNMNSQFNMNQTHNLLCSLCLHFFTLPGNVLFIQTNSFIIFTCPNSVLIVPVSGKWVSVKTALDRECHAVLAWFLKQNEQ